MLAALLLAATLVGFLLAAILLGSIIAALVIITVVIAFAVAIGRAFIDRLITRRGIGAGNPTGAPSSCTSRVLKK